MYDIAPLTVACHCLGRFKQTVSPTSPGLSATFTLGEGLIVLGPQVMLTLSLRGQATVETSRPLTWPLHLKRPTPDAAGLLLPLTQPPLDVATVSAPT